MGVVLTVLMAFQFKKWVITQVAEIIDESGKIPITMIFVKTVRGKRVSASRQYVMILSVCYRINDCLLSDGARLE